jgi:hypothetical protein
LSQGLFIPHYKFIPQYNKEAFSSHSTIKQPFCPAVQ